MKWTACYIVLNGEEYIWYSIKSIQKFIQNSGGKIIIIEGSTKYANLVAEDGNSIDNTKSIITNIVKEDPDLFIYKRVGRVDNKATLRNMYLNVIKELPKEEQPDWLLVVDDDELYKEEDLKQLDKYLNRTDNIVHVFNPQYWFWKDFNHICTIDEQLVREEIKSGKRRDKIFYDAFGNDIRQGQYDVDHKTNELIFTRKTEHNYKPNNFNGDMLYSKDKQFHDMFIQNIDTFYVRYHWKDKISYRIIDK